jgi:hypothetical protein
LLVSQFEVDHRSAFWPMRLGRSARRGLRFDRRRGYVEPTPTSQGGLA